MTRRGLLLAIPALTLRADDARDVWDLLTNLATLLSEGNATEFLEAFDRSMPGYAELEANIRALLLQDDVQSSIDLLSDEGDASERKIDLDWFLQLVNQQDPTNVTRRRERVHCRLIKQRKKWTVTTLMPVDLFAPPRP
jgi:hypothetical protein